MPPCGTAAEQVQFHTAQTLRIVGSGIGPTSMDTPAHCANRFSPLTTEVDEPLTGFRTLPSVSQTQSALSSMPSTLLPTATSGEEIDDDFGGNSEPDVEEASTLEPHHKVIAPIGVDVARAAMARGFRSLDQVTLDTKFRSRGCLMRVVPKVMRGAFRTALRLSFQEAAEASAAGNVEVHVRATNADHQTPTRWGRVQSETCRSL